MPSVGVGRSANSFQWVNFNECIGLESSVENTWPRRSYPESTMHFGCQLSFRSTVRKPIIESAHDLHELASQQDERAPQYEGNAIE